MVEQIELGEDNITIMEPTEPFQQKTTSFVILFSLYIGLAGWIYNFDLGRYKSL